MHESHRWNDLNYRNLFLLSFGSLCLRPWCWHGWILERTLWFEDSYYLSVFSHDGRKDLSAPFLFKRPQSWPPQNLIIPQRLHFHEPSQQVLGLQHVDLGSMHSVHLSGKEIVSGKVMVLGRKYGASLTTEGKRCWRLNRTIALCCPTFIQIHCLYIYFICKLFLFCQFIVQSWLEIYFKIKSYISALLVYESSCHDFNIIYS